MAAIAAFTDTDEPMLLREDAGGIAIVTLNRPRAMNALSRGLMAALTAELERIHDDAGVRAVVLAGAGRAFCAGHDLKEMSAARAEADRGRAFFEATFAECSRVMMTITRLRQPVIAAVHGVATAAGCQLVATCDLAVAAEDAKFATPGVNIGLFCSTPMVAVSRAAPRKVAMEMLLLGEMADAATAKDNGLVNRVVPAAQVLDVARAFAATIASKSPLTLAVGKEAFYAQAEMGLEAAYAYAAEVMTTNMLARDAEEGINAFIEKRPPVWEGR